MLTIISYLIGPVVGGIIGGFTNKIAIRMLFRPYKEHHIGPVHIPFTPGIIPKEKERLAQSIGQMVGTELLNSETLAQTLLSPEMESKVATTLDNLISRMLTNQQSFQQFITQYIPSEQFGQATQSIKSDIVQALYAKLDNPAVGEKVATMAMDHLADSQSNSFLGRLGTFALPMLRAPLEHKLASLVNGMLHENGKQIVTDLVDQELDKLLARPIADLCRGREQFIYQIRQALISAYRQMVSNNLPRILATLDIQNIVAQRINAMDMRSMEQMIVSTMDKELKALVWFGVFLGFIMGCITTIVNVLM